MDPVTRDQMVNEAVCISENTDIIGKGMHLISIRPRYSCHYLTWGVYGFVYIYIYIYIYMKEY